MPTHALPPLAFAPLPVARPWGGSRAAAVLGVSTPASVAAPIGEWWLISARRAAPTRVVSGPLAGIALDELLARDAAAILGPRSSTRPESRFPLLLKLLDTAQPLSVQVHPSDEALPGEGKTESWYVVDAAAGAHFWLGLKSGALVTDVIARARRSESPEPLLARHEAKRGLLAHLPPGTIHALGAGIVALEFQTNADTTWRIWDWGRLPARALHLDEAALDCGDDQRAQLLAATPEPTHSPPCDRLVDCAAYSVERMHVRAPTHLSTDGERVEIVVTLSSALRVRSEAGAADAPRGHAVLLPATSGDYVVTPEQPAELLRFLPARTDRTRTAR